MLFPWSHLLPLVFTNIPYRSLSLEVGVGWIKTPRLGLNASVSQSACCMAMGLFLGQLLSNGISLTVSITCQGRLGVVCQHKSDYMILGNFLLWFLLSYIFGCLLDCFHYFIVFLFVFKESIMLHSLFKMKLATVEEVEMIWEELEQGKE